MAANVLIRRWLHRGAGANEECPLGLSSTLIAPIVKRKQGKMILQVMLQKNINGYFEEDYDDEVEAVEEDEYLIAEEEAEVGAKGEASFYSTAGDLSMRTDEDEILRFYELHRLHVLSKA